MSIANPAETPCLGIAGSNPLQTLSKPFAVIPVIKDKPKIIKIIKKRTVIIECVVVSKFEPKCTWFKETTEVHETERHRVDIQQVRDGEYAVKLEIGQIVDTDRGAYKLIARNEKGEAVSQVVDLQDIPEEEKVAAPKPHIVRQLRGAQLVEGAALELVCAVREVDKKARVVWYRNETVISERTSREVRTTFDGQTARLSIEQTLTQHSATYRVVISNESGGDESSSRVEVRRKEEEKKEEEEVVEKEEEVVEEKVSVGGAEGVC